MMERASYVIYLVLALLSLFGLLFFGESVYQLVHEEYKKGLLHLILGAVLIGAAVVVYINFKDYLPSY